MSFLNPVNEPVLRFKSTDAGAPQVNYNARVAGDVKAVLKACLVTGYGAKSSAGWSAVNEVDHVAEFVSPSAAMSDYRLGIDDTSTSSTTWYYQYQNVRADPSYSTPTKSFSLTNKTHADNGWQLLVTARGMIFIELVQHSIVNKISARITYWGALKSAVPSVNGNNICFFNIGNNATMNIPGYFYSSPLYVHTNLESHTNAWMTAATSHMLSTNVYVLNASNVDLVSPIYLANNNKSLLIGELPPMLSAIINNSNGLYSISEQTLDSRTLLSVCAGFANSVLETSLSYARTFLIRTDYWEY